MLTAGEVTRPVDAVRQLVSLGLSLRRAREILDRLAAGHPVAVALTPPAGRDSRADLATLGIAARAIGRPRVDARAVRERLALSQKEFALRFGLELDTIRNWEQGRNMPDPAAQILLKLIETDPQAVDAALVRDA